MAHLWEDAEKLGIKSRGQGRVISKSYILMLNMYPRTMARICSVGFVDSGNGYRSLT